jgi:hypothetical protein
MLSDIDVRYFATAHITFVEGAFAERASAMAGALGVPIEELIPNEAGYSCASLALQGVEIELGDNRAHGMIVTLSWEVDHEHTARAAVACVLEKLGWVAWRISSFDGQPRWPDLVDEGAQPSIAGALESLENQLRRLQKLREMDAPEPIVHGAEQAIADASSTARRRGWRGDGAHLAADVRALWAELAARGVGPDLARAFASLVDRLREMKELVEVGAPHHEQDEAAARMDEATALAYEHGWDGDMAKLPDDARALWSELDALFRPLDVESALAKLTKHLRELKRLNEIGASADLVDREGANADEAAAVAIDAGWDGAPERLPADVRDMLMSPT